MIAEFETGKGPDDVINHILKLQEFGKLYYCIVMMSQNRDMHVI